MIIKEIIKEDFARMSEIMQSAYAGSYSGTVEEKERIEKIFLEITTESDLVALGAYDGETLMGCVLHYVFDTNFHGEMIKTAGIGSLAVDLLHKKKRVAQQLIKESFKLAKDEGIELYYLYPFSTEFYRNFGFGYGVPVDTYCVRPEDFMNVGNKDLLSYATADDHEAIFELYDEKAKTTHGMSLKTYADKRRIKKFTAGKIIVCKEHDELLGYMVMSQKGLHTENNQSQKIFVSEMMYKNRQALLSFTSFFNAQKDQVDYIELATFDQSFNQLLNNTCFAPKPQTMPIISLKVADKSLGLMPLVLDVSALLNRLSKRTTKKVEMTIQYPKKTSETVLIPGDGEGIKMTLSINSYSSWITGVITLKALYDHGQLETETPEALTPLDREFYLEKPQSYTRY